MRRARKLQRAAALLRRFTLPFRTYSFSHDLFLPLPFARSSKPAWTVVLIPLKEDRARTAEKLAQVGKVLHELFIIIWILMPIVGMHTARLQLVGVFQTALHQVDM